MALATNNISKQSNATPANAAGQDITWISLWDGSDRSTSQFLARQAITSNPDALAEGDVIRITQNTIRLLQVPTGQNLLAAIRVTNDGADYTTAAPAVTISGSGGAAATAVVNDGKVVRVDVTNPGRNYATVPTIGFTPDSSDTITDAATATAILSGGETEEMARRKLQGAVANGVWVHFHTGDPGTAGTTNLATGMDPIQFLETEFTIT